MATRIKITSDERDFLRGQQKVTQSVEDAKDEVRELLRETKRLEQAGVRAFRQMEDSGEKYERQVKEIRAAVRAGRLTQEQGNEAINRMGARFNRAGTIGRTAMRGISGGVMAMLGPLSSATAAIAGMITQLQEARQQGELFIQGASFGAYGALAQLGDPTVKRTARQLAIGGAFENLNQAAATAQQAVSAQLTRSEVNALRQALEAQVIEIGRSSQTTEQLSFLLQNFGRAEVTGFEELMSKAIAAAAPSQALMGDVAAIAGRTATTAQQMGMSDEELLALAGLMRAKGGQEVATSRTEQLLAALQNIGAEGTTLAEKMQDAQRRIEEGGGLTKVIGQDQSALAGFRILTRDMEQYRKILNDIINAERTNVLQQRIRESLEDPTVRAGLLRRRVTIREQFLEEERGIADAERANRMQEIIAGERARGLLPGQEFGRRMLAGTARFVGLPEDVEASLLQRGANRDEAREEETRRMGRKFIEDMAETATNTRPRPQVPRPEN